MPTLVSDLVNQAFLNLGVIQPGEGVTLSMQADSLLRLNQILGNLSTEGATAFNQVSQLFGLIPGFTSYTLGIGGIFSTVSRAQKVKAWRAIGTQVTTGGNVLSIAEFGVAVGQADDGIGMQSVVPRFVGADTAFPLINVRVWPAPSASPGQLELDYFTPITAFNTIGDTVNLPQGWEKLLHWSLSADLFSQYARPGQTIEVIAANVQNAKASIVDQNQMGPTPPVQQ